MTTALLLVRLATLFFAARLAAEGAERVGLPPVLAEIGAGVVLGPSVLGWLVKGEPLSFLGELGAILLLCEVGLHMDVGELRRVGRSALQVAWIGVLLPLAGGFAALRALGAGPRVALFLAAGTTATSVGVTARVFGDLRALATTEAQTVLGAAVADDVIGLLILTVVARLAQGGRLDPLQVFLVCASGVLFVVVVGGAGIVFVPRLFEGVVDRARGEGTLVVGGIGVALLCAGLAGAAGLAPIVGGFVAGLALRGIRDREDLVRRLRPVGHLFVPVFFLLIGVETRVQSLFSRPALLVALVLGATAVAGKVAAGVGVRRGEADRITVGVGMIPRGEVGLVFATLGLSSGVLGDDQHAALLLVVLATTVIAPPWIRSRVGRIRRGGRGHVEPEPEAGWLDERVSEVELRGRPPAEAAWRVALRAAQACRDLRPGPRLADYVRTQITGPPQWDGELRSEFMRLLAVADDRSWRFLDITGALPHLLPDLDRALRRRARDPFDLGPPGPVDLELWRAVRRTLEENPPEGVDRDALLLAAFCLGAWGHEAPRVVDRVSGALALEATCRDLVKFLVTEHDLLSAAARRADLGREEAIVELALHIGDRARADTLHVLALAAEDDPTVRRRLGELHELVGAVLAQPEFSGGGAGAVVERRRHEALAALPATASAAVRRLVATAPRRYLLSHPAREIARHAVLLDPPPVRGEVRLRAEPDLERGEWTVLVCALDLPGTLAALAWAFAHHGLPIVEASVSTWPSHLAVDTFRVAAPPSTDWEAVRRAAETALRAPGRNGCPEPIRGRIDIDNSASPWYSIVEVRAEDRTGLLYRVAAALSRAGIQIHHATVRTVEGVAVDTFLVTGPRGHKLTPRDERELLLSFEGRLAARLSPARLWRRPGRERTALA